MPLRDMTREEALAVLGIDKITPDVKAALAVLAPWWSPSDCKAPGRYVAPMGGNLYRLDEREEGEPASGWETWNEETEQWERDMPLEPLHFIPNIKGG